MKTSIPHRRRAFGTLVCLFLVTAAGPSAAQAATGDLDPTFSGDGVQTISFGGDEQASALAIQADGKIVAAGRGAVPDSIALARFDADGSLDPTFSADGMQTLSLPGPGSTSASGVVLQADGKIVVAGVTNGDFVVARFGTDGSLDASFSGDGVQTTDFGGFDFANGIGVQGDGKIVVAGGGGAGAGSFALARYNTDGSLDTTFSGDGKQTTTFAGPSQANDLAMQTDGKVIAVGDDGVGDFALARYNTDGSLDTTFSGDGQQTAVFGGAGPVAFNAAAAAVAVQTDGKILAAGGSGSTDDFGLARFNTDGSLDASFSGDGKQTTDFGGFDDVAGIALQPDGRVLAGGETQTCTAGVGGSLNCSASDFALARYNSDGSLDGTFSGDGKQTSSFGVFDTLAAVALQSDGQILAGGSTVGGFTLARYNGDTPPAPPPPPPGAMPPVPPPAVVPTPAAVSPTRPDTTAPTATLSAKSSQKLSSTLTLKITCVLERCTARVTGSIRVPKIGTTKAKTLKLKAVGVNVEQGATATVKLKLSASQQSAINRALRRGRALSAKVTVAIVDAAGNLRTLHRTIKLKRP